MNLPPLSLPLPRFSSCGEIPDEWLVEGHKIVPQVLTKHCIGHCLGLRGKGLGFSARKQCTASPRGGSHPPLIRAGATHGDGCRASNPVQLVLVNEQDSDVPHAAQWMQSMLPRHHPRAILRFSNAPALDESTSYCISTCASREDIVQDVALEMRCKENPPSFMCFARNAVKL